MEHINRYAAPEVKEAVVKGEMSISTANEVANLDEDEQKELIENKPVSKITHKEVKEKTEKKPKKEVEIIPEKMYNCDKDEKNFIPDFELEPDEPEDKISDYYEDEFEEEEQEKIIPSVSDEPVILTGKEITALNHFLPDLIENCKQTDPYYYLILNDLLEKIM